MAHIKKDLKRKKNTGLERVGLSRDLPDSPVLTAVWAQGLWGTRCSGCLAPGFLGCQSCQAVAFQGDCRAGERKAGAGHKSSVLLLRFSPPFVFL